MPEDSADRLERIVRDLLRGRRLRLRPNDSGERDAIMAAARLAAARQGYPRMSPAFRRQLAAQLSEPARQGWISRRAALVAGLGVAAGTLAGIGIGRGVQVPSVAMRVSPPPSSPPPAIVVDAYIEPRRPVWTPVAKLTELPEGQPVKVRAGSVGAYIVRHGNQVTGVTSICSHLPCELEWRPSSGDLLCPCHNIGFKLDGRPADPAYQDQLLPLSQVWVRVVDGQVEVQGT